MNNFSERSDMTYRCVAYYRISMKLYPEGNDQVSEWEGNLKRCYTSRNYSTSQDHLKTGSVIDFLVYLNNIMFGADAFHDESIMLKMSCLSRKTSRLANWKDIFLCFFNAVPLKLWQQPKVTWRSLSYCLRRVQMWPREAQRLSLKQLPKGILR